jgi:hypothetical protein
MTRLICWKAGKLEGFLLNITSCYSGCFFRHASEGGHPVDSLQNLLDSYRKEGLLSSKLPDCSFI